MGEEETRDMPPQEDSSKDPLTDGNGAAAIEVKADAVNEETKDDMPTEFKGLTKEELLQYAKEPFWVRLRIFLMVFFWAGWLVMLGLAVYIIVEAPRCEPPPTITWLQQSPILQLDIETPPQNVTSLLASLGLTSLYIPGLISDHDYNLMNTSYVKEMVMSMLEVVSGSDAYIVTDFVPSPVKHYHLWTKNATFQDILDGNTLTLNYDAPELEPKLVDVFHHWQSEYNVSGFLVPDEELQNEPDLRNLTLLLNEQLNPAIVVGESAVDLGPTLDNLNIPGAFKAFVTQNFTDWTYYKFSPVYAAHRTASPHQMPAVTVALMLLPGTPLLQVSSSELLTFESSFSDLVIQCVKLRNTDAIRFGVTQFANSTDQVVAFTRTLKGTPGYAVAINLGADTEVVNFSNLEFVPPAGTMIYKIEGITDTESTKLNLDAVSVEGMSAVVLQFVARYD